MTFSSFEFGSRPPRATLLPYTALFRSRLPADQARTRAAGRNLRRAAHTRLPSPAAALQEAPQAALHLAAPHPAGDPPEGPSRPEALPPVAAPTRLAALHPAAAPSLPADPRPAVLPRADRSRREVVRNRSR